jgi:hypothetical protein
MFTGQMQGQRFEEVAIPPEPSAIIAFCREFKVFALNNFRRPPDRFVGIHLPITIHEQPVVYELLGVIIAHHKLSKNETTH